MYILVTEVSNIINIGAADFMDASLYQGMVCAAVGVRRSHGHLSLGKKLLQLSMQAHVCVCTIYASVCVCVYMCTCPCAPSARLCVHVCVRVCVSVPACVVKGRWKWTWRGVPSPVQ